MSLNRIVLDWETAYGQHPETGELITLSKQTTEEYVRHPRFKAHGLGIKINGGPSRYYYRPAELARVLRLIPWERSLVIAHHSQFDLAILSWRLGIRPAWCLCTMSMARALYPAESSSLANVARLLELPPKGVELENFRNKWELTDEEQRVLGRYCCNDVDLTAMIFDRLAPRFPASELRLIDWTVRAFTEPLIEIDPAPLVRAYVRERRTKRALIKACVSDKKVLASNDQFAALLLTCGVDPPKKVSPAKIKDGRVDPDKAGDPPQGILPDFKAPKGASVEQRQQLQAEKTHYPWSYAFGKSDEEFKMLLDHPDPTIQTLIEARMGVKSTIIETRTKRFYKIGRRGAFPVYLNYYGAHSGRWSGGDKQNPQNQNRVNPDDPESGALRRSWLAPPGHVVLVRDLGQIEARQLVYWAGQEDMLEVFRRGLDPYCFMATKIYGREIKKANKKERFIGKTVVLGCGYQLGWATLQESIRVGFMGMPGVLFDQAYVEQLGVNVEAFCFAKSYQPGFATCMGQALALKPLNVTAEQHLIHCAVTKHIVDSFRVANNRVVALWREVGRALSVILQGLVLEVGARPLIHTHPEGLRLPNGMLIRYTKLRQGHDGQLKYLANVKRKMWTKIYAGKAVENCVQALARLVISDQKLRIIDRLKDYSLRSSEHARVVSSTHDELITIAPERYAESVLDMMGQEMKIPPAWCRDLPLKSSGGFARNYGDCDK